MLSLKFTLKNLFSFINIKYIATFKKSFDKIYINKFHKYKFIFLKLIDKLKLRPAGFEPATCGLEGRCSSAELRALK